MAAKKLCLGHQKERLEITEKNGEEGEGGERMVFSSWGEVGDVSRMLYLP